MAYPYTQLYGDAVVSVTATATGATDGDTAQKIGISLGLPVVEQISDILLRFKIDRTKHIADGKLVFKLTHGAVDLKEGQTFAAQGVHNGDSLVLADV